MLLRALMAAALLALSAAPGRGQVYGPPLPAQERASSVDPASAAALAQRMMTGGASALGESVNPVSVLESAVSAVRGGGAASEGGVGGDVGRRGLSGAINVLLLLTVLSLAPAIVVMCTCFVRIIIVLGLLKQALGTQSLPPAQVVFGLSMFMTFFVMGPTFERVHREAILPYERGEVASQVEMWERAKAPMRDFMFDQIEMTGNWASVYMLLEHRGVDTSRPERLTRADVDTVVLVPAFMLSELKTAFLMGFRVYLPFLVIDMVIASILISMSMMMLPPVLISLPFKLLLFVLVDGWTLVVGSLIHSFAQPGTAARLSAAAQAVGGG